MALELFGEDFKNELLEELVQLNVKAMAESKTTSIKEVRTGLQSKMSKRKQVGVVRKLKISETQGKISA